MIVEINKNVVNPPKQVSFICGGIMYIIRMFQDNKCFFCEKEMNDIMNSPMAVSRDHFFPNSKGFTFNGNLILACRACNTKKGSRVPRRAMIRKFVKLYDDIGLECCAKIIVDDDDKITFKQIDYSSIPPTSSI